MIRRPRSLVRRTIQGRAFSEIAYRIDVTTERNDFGEPENNETRTEILCSTAPPSSSDSRVRHVLEEGIRLEALRKFWTLNNVDPVADMNAGDIIEYQDERFRVRETQRWGEFSESLCVRIEGQ